MAATADPKITRARLLAWGGRAARVGLFLLVTAAGAWLGLLIGGRATADLGPVQTVITVNPRVLGHTVVDIPPLGELDIDSHRGPLGLSVTVQAVDVTEARALLNDRTSLESLGDGLAEDLRAGVVEATIRGLLSAAVGAAIAAAIAYRSTRKAAMSAGVTAGVLLASYATAWATYDPGSISEPRYSGILANAPQLVGDARQIAENVTAYGEQLGRLVENVAQLYSTTLALPSFEASDDTIRVLHVSDLHLNPSAWPVIASVVQQFAIDVVVDTGDIADHGTPPENVYVDEISGLEVPYVYVRGNHDSTATEAAVAAEPNAVVLDGEVAEVAGIRFLGVPDPRFTPDQHTRDPEGESAVLRQSTERLADAARAADPPVDVLAIHDPTDAELLDGTAPLVLAGHTHERREELLPEGTRLMVQGSTGGAGLRALEGEEPTPVTLTVLYFDQDTKDLAAWDDITLGGLGLTSAEIDRHVAERRTARRRTRSSRRRRPESASRGRHFGGRAGQAVCFLRPRRPRAVGRAEHGAPSSSSGPGHRPFKAAARVRIPLGALLHPSIG